MVLPIKIFILLLCCYAAGPASAQNGTAFRFANFDVKDGLTEKYIYSTTQDKQGYMWFGTGTGLFRYDGASFKAFRSTIDKTGNNISNILQAVYTDKQGNLWLGSLNDLQWYNPAANRFWRTEQTGAVAKKLLRSYVGSFSSADGDDVWITTVYNYFFRFNQADSSFTDYSGIFPASASKSTLKVLHTANGLFAVHQEGIYQFSSSNKPAVFYPLPYKNDGITNAANTTEGITLTTFASGVVVFSPLSKTFSKSGFNNAVLEKNNLFSLAEDGSDLWLGSYPLFKAGGTGTPVSFVNSFKNDFEIKANKIVCLYFDREHNLWICSHSGLSMLPWQNQQVKNIVLADVRPGSLIEPTGVWGISGTNNLVIANSSSGGLACYDAAANTVKVIPNPLVKDKPDSRIIGIIQLKDGTLFASDDKNFFKFNQGTWQLQPYILKDQNGRSIINAGRNVTSKNGTVYISSVNNGFYVWNTVSGALNHYDKTVADAGADIKTDNALYPSLADDNDNIWFTSTNGIYQLDTRQNKWKHYTGEDAADVPPMTNTNYITQDRQGHIWTATINNGLYELYFENNKVVIKNYGKTSGIGLSTDYVAKIKPDKKENILWVSTISGVHRFDPVAKKILSTLSIQNGLAADGGGYTFNITDNNRLVVLFYGLCSIIDLNSYQYNTAAPEIAFNAVKVMDKELLHSITNNSLQLGYDKNFLQFEFAALQYNNSNRLQYAYKLEGADKEWIYSGSRNEVSYSGLAPGKYTFKVKAANNDGLWSNTEKQLFITIKNPFWKTAWFIGLCLLLITVILFALYKMRLTAVRREESLKANFSQQIADMEMRALRAQMNPHFIFNSLNSIQKYILKNEHFEASQYLTKFSRLIRLILDHSNQNNILLSSEMELLRLYCEMECLRFDNKFTYNIKAGSDIPADTVEIPSMLIQPYAENAIWHGLLHKDNPGHLTIAFSLKEKNILRVLVEDDGVGRQKAAELKSKQVLKKKSYGIKITEDRIAIINRMNNINASSTITDLTDGAGNAAGTSVVLEIPVNPVS